MQPMKDLIAQHARRQFDRHGYHGAALRDICKLAGCKMPTLYYYYESKEVLYDRIVGEAFVELVPRLWQRLPIGLAPQEHAAEMVIQKKDLTEDERMIYRLAMKTWLGFEDVGPCRQRLLQWEQATYEDSWKQYHELVGSKRWAKFISRSITSIILRIILLDERISDDEIREEIGMVFAVAMAPKGSGKDEHDGYS